MRLQNELKKADLLIIDADGTIAPNLTAGLANKIAKFHILRLINKNIKPQKESRILTTKDAISDIVKHLVKCKIRPSTNIAHYFMVLKLALFGILLHATRATSNIVGCKDNTFLIKLFRESIEGINLRPFLFTKKEIENSLYPCAKEFVKSLKCKKVMITQSFKCANSMVEHYKIILGLDAIISNTMALDKKGRLRSMAIKISGAASKARCAAKIKAKNIVLLANDNTDIGIAALPNVKMVISRKPTRILRKLSTISIRDYCEIFEKRKTKN
jgi:hypothetical protein